MPQAGIGTQEEPVKFQQDGFARDVYSEKCLCEFLVYDVQILVMFMIHTKRLLHLLLKHCCCFHHYGYVNRHFQF